VIVSRKHGYVFVEVPHTGSVAISAELLENYDGEEILRKHATHSDFLRQATPDEKRYFAFAAVRNPLDLTVSRYFKLKLKHRPPQFLDPAWVAKHGSIVQKRDLRIDHWIERTDASFSDFLLRWYRVPFDSWISVERRRYGRVMRFENLAADFEATLRQIGIVPVRPLPQANVTPGRGGSWPDYYSAAARRRAIWVFGPFMREWGYDFPADWGDVRVPRWATAYLRLARGVRSIYWNFFRFRDPRRPGRLAASALDTKPDQERE